MVPRSYLFPSLSIEDSQPNYQETVSREVGRLNYNVVCQQKGQSAKLPKDGQQRGRLAKLPCDGQRRGQSAKIPKNGEQKGRPVKLPCVSREDNQQNYQEKVSREDGQQSWRSVELPCDSQQRKQLAKGGGCEWYSLHPMDQQGSLCCNTFLTVTQSYHSKVTPIGTLPAEKIAEAVMLYVFTIALPADRTFGRITVWLSAEGTVSQRWRMRIIFKMHRARQLQLFSPHPIDKQESPCCHTFLTVTQSYHSKVTIVVDCLLRQ